MDTLLPIVVSQLVLLPIESDALALAVGVLVPPAGFDVAADGPDGPEIEHPARNATAQQSAADRKGTLCHRRGAIHSANH